MKPCFIVTDYFLTLNSQASTQDSKAYNSHGDVYKPELFGIHQQYNCLQRESFEN